jgi:type IV secretory pathway VirB2 component (pilin)
VKNYINRHKQIARNEKWTTLALICVICLMPTFAYAAPWDNMADTILDFLTNGFTRTIAIIACIGLGLAAWAGKLSWVMGARFIGGIVFIFGAAAIVDLLIGGV